MLHDALKGTFCRNVQFRTHTTKLTATKYTTKDKKNALFYSLN